jgi:hypothetical protein
MKYLVAFLFALSLFACKKGEDSGAPPTKDSTVIIVKDTPAAPVTRIYTGMYISREIFDDAVNVYYLDTAFQDTMSVTFIDSLNIRCKLYTYTIYHDRQFPNHAGPAGRDSLEFSCRIEIPGTNLDTLSPPVKGGGIRFTSGRDSVYFGNIYHSGQVGYFHDASFAGKRQ